MKVTINGARYATNGVDVDESAQDLDTTDSEGLPGCGGGIASVGGVTYTITSGTNAAPCALTLSATPSPELVVGQQVTLVGTTGATSFAGTYIVTVVAGAVITLDNTVAPGGAITGGVMTVGGLVQIGTKSKVAGPKAATITIKKPTWDSGQNPYFLAPFEFSVQGYDQIAIFPEGVGSGAPLWLFYSALLTRATFNNDVNALEPLSVTYVSDGGYLTPSADA